MGRLSPIVNTAPQVLATATLILETRGAVFSEITRDVADFLREVAAGEGTLLLYLRHTSASLVIQENADPDVQDDLMTALARLGSRHRGAGRHAGAYQGDSQWHIAQCPGHQR
jgi:secondary thiamine-phosphate synthase enzyme